MTFFSQHLQLASRLCCWFMHKSVFTRCPWKLQYEQRLCLSAPLTHSSLKDCKWKMYIELDGDDVAVTYIKDVVFNANRQDVEVLRMAKVPSQSVLLPLIYSGTVFDVLQSVRSLHVSSPSGKILLEKKNSV